MEVPEDVRVGLQGIKQTLHVRLNTTAKFLRGHSFDVNGNPRKVEFDPRWEIWDTDESGREYKVVTLEGPGETFAPLGAWVVELMQHLNPERTEGDLHKLIDLLVDQPNKNVERVNQDTYERIIDFLADLCWSEENRGSRIVVPQPMV